MFCFRCGVCCETYQAPFNALEAEEMARGTGLSTRQFLERYADPRWPGEDSYVLRHHQGACVFLERDYHSTRCVIHTCRPKACRDWVAGPVKTECRNGLNREWGLIMMPSGEWDGPPARLAQFGLFLDQIHYG